MARVSSKVTHAPFDSKGNLLEWTAANGPDDKYGGALRYGTYGDLVEWRKIEAFTATLTIEDMERGRSAMRFIWKDPEGRKYPMFMRDALDVLKHRSLTDGTLTDEWIVVKRGANYGIALTGIERKRGPAVQWHSEYTCVRCGRKGFHKFRWIEYGQMERRDFTGRVTMQTGYLRDANGWMQECAIVTSCGERRKRLTDAQRKALDDAVDAAKALIDSQAEIREWEARHA